MKELHDIIQAYDKAVLQYQQAVLATVVKVEGSSYRRPGARMLVTEDGHITGAISGGCLEGDALRKAWLARSQRQNKLEIYDTTDEDDAKLGIQLGCNGIVYILFEPINSDDKYNPVNLLKKAAQQRKEAVLATLFNEDKSKEQQGTCCFINEEEKIYTGAEYTAITSDAMNALEKKTSVVTTYQEGSVIYQYVPPVIHLIIAGAGNDAQPLAEMASLLGWQITIVDGRASHATQQRFPKASQVMVEKPGQVLAWIQADEQTAVVLMTHNYNYDLVLLSSLLTSNCGYVGVLGPKAKLQRMFQEIQETELSITDERLYAVYGPTGLDIGAETAEEIALSVIAEIKAVLSGRKGTLLRDKPFPIHPRLIASHYD